MKKKDYDYLLCVCGNMTMRTIHIHFTFCLFDSEFLNEIDELQMFGTVR